MGDLRRLAVCAFLFGSYVVACGGVGTATTTPTDGGGEGRSSGGVASGSTSSGGPMSGSGSTSGGSSSSGSSDGGSTSSSGGGSSGSGALCGVNGTNACPANQHCDPTLGCVTCTMDSQCPMAAPFCLQGACGACRTNADCGSGATPVCDPATQTCHAACNPDAAVPMCPAKAPICTSTGACVGCTSSSTCPATQKVCDTTTGQCVQCQANGDCPASQPRCLVSQGQCVQCLSNSDCGTTHPVCDPQTFMCTAGCTSDSQCPTAMPHCDLATAQCVPGCSMSSQCPAGTPKCDPTTAQCVQCLANMDCAGTATPVCSPQNRCVVCASNMDCPMATPYCQTKGVGGIVPGCVQCLQSSQCPTMQLCVNGTCL